MTNKDRDAKIATKERPRKDSNDPGFFNFAKVRYPTARFRSKKKLHPLRKRYTHKDHFSKDRNPKRNRDHSYAPIPESTHKSTSS